MLCKTVAFAAGFCLLFLVPVLSEYLSSLGMAQEPVVIKGVYDESVSMELARTESAQK